MTTNKQLAQNKEHKDLYNKAWYQRKKARAAQALLAGNSSAN